MDTILGYCSTKLAKYSQYDSEIIKFAMKLWLSSIGQSFVMMCIAYLFFDIKYFFHFFMAFFPLRLLIDGYHCLIALLLAHFILWLFVFWVILLLFVNG